MKHSRYNGIVQFTYQININDLIKGYSLIFNGYEQQHFPENRKYLPHFIFRFERLLSLHRYKVCVCIRYSLYMQVLACKSLENNVHLRYVLYCLLKHFVDFKLVPQNTNKENIILKYYILIEKFTNYWYVVPLIS